MHGHSTRQVQHWLFDDILEEPQETESSQVYQWTENGEKLLHLTLGGTWRKEHVE